MTNYESSMRRRFNLGSGECKDIEIFMLEKHTKKMSLFEELGEVVVPLRPYLLELTIAGGAKPWEGTIHMSVSDKSVGVETMFDVPNRYQKLGFIEDGAR
jgi:hypothetical protein